MHFFKVENPTEYLQGAFSIKFPAQGAPGETDSAGAHSSQGASKGSRKTLDTFDNLEMFHNFDIGHF